MIFNNQIVMLFLKLISKSIFPINVCDSKGWQEAREQLGVLVKAPRFGRRRSIDRNRVETLHKQGVGAIEIDRQLNIARSTVYKIREDDITKKLKF
nr:helix-turn-helix domain-containing protein [Providencia sp. PROV271]